MPRAKHRPSRQWLRLQQVQTGPVDGDGARPGARHDGAGLWRRRSGEFVALAVVGVVVVGAGALLILRSSRQGVLPSVTLAGTDVGGLDERALRAVAERVGIREGGKRATAVRPAGGSFTGASASATLQEMGFRVDI